MLFSFTYSSDYDDAKAGDEIWIEFPTVDNFYPKIFNDDLGFTTDSLGQAEISCFEYTPGAIVPNP